MSRKKETLAVQRRRESRHQEFAIQRELVEKLERHLGPRVFFTSLENRPRSPWAALHQQARGVKSGLPDIAVVVRGPSAGFVKLVFIELKSWRGKASARQREVAAEIMASGAAWYLARSVKAALTALAREGVGLRRWKPPARLRPWEGPFSDPQARLPMHPAILREQRAARRRWRARAQQRAQEAARRAAQPSPIIPGLQLVANDAQA